MEMGGKVLDEMDGWGVVGGLRGDKKIGMVEGMKDEVEMVVWMKGKEMEGEKMGGEVGMV